MHRLIAATLGVGLAATAQAALVGHYPFDGNGNDIATADGAQNATVSGASYVAGIAGSGALSFNGTSHYASATSNFTQNTTGVTMTAWIKFSTVPNSGVPMVILQMPINGGTLAQSAASLEITFGQLVTGGRSAVADGYQSGTTTGVSWQTSKPYFAAGVLNYTTKEATVYLYDGADWVTATTGSRLWASNQNTVGDVGLTVGRRADGQRYFNGVIDEVQVYNTALDAASVQAIVPEPASLGLIGLAGAALLVRRRNA